MHQSLKTIKGNRYHILRHLLVFLIIYLLNFNIEICKGNTYIPPQQNEQTLWQTDINHYLQLQSESPLLEQGTQSSFIARIFQFKWVNKVHFNKTRIKKKLFLALSILLTGPIGGHRLILGTKPHVPIIYAITLGGGLGLIPLIDLIMILTSKDISQYKNNSKIIMWAE